MHARAHARTHAHSQTCSEFRTAFYATVRVSVNAFLSDQNPRSPSPQPPLRRNQICGVFWWGQCDKLKWDLIWLICQPGFLQCKVSIHCDIILCLFVCYIRSHLNNDAHTRIHISIYTHTLSNWSLCNCFDCQMHSIFSFLVLALSLTHTQPLTSFYPPSISQYQSFSGIHTNT